MGAEDANEQYLTVQETARRLGISRPTVYRLLETGRLPSVTHPVTGRRQVPEPAVRRLQALRTEGAAPNEPAASVPTADPAAADGAAVDSIYRLHELALDPGVDDLSDWVAYYRYRGLPDASHGVSGHIGTDRDQRAAGSPPRPGAGGADAAAGG